MRAKVIVIVCLLPGLFYSQAVKEISGDYKAQVVTYRRQWKQNSSSPQWSKGTAKLFVLSLHSNSTCLYRSRTYKYLGFFNRQGDSLICTFTQTSHKRPLEDTIVQYYLKAGKNCFLSLNDKAVYWKQDTLHNKR